MENDKPSPKPIGDFVKDPNRKQIARLTPKINARLEALPPEFPGEVKPALFGAEMMFRVQGGCAPFMQVHDFMAPVPDNVQSYPELLTHMASLLTTKPGATAVYFSFTSTPQGGGSNDGRSTIVCLFMTHHFHYDMRAEITGVRSLGEWTLKQIPRPTT